ncbi:hypothetical protein [Leptospira biflexa]|uniref:hypothetical protein n=1 Tax=Leptospira biflexa TaxID=172 RepID=UPI0010838457|nr:hypothetical protein [Leptospira biflexa]TGM30725.1 hypothetical protein EHQ89_18090 [Leptospira biflexa]TGM34769.1 hypothetical protein EHQ80_14070 [Leptospira biflexa]
MKKSEMKETAKLGVGFLLGFLVNRYVAKSEMVRRLHTDNPAIASVGASAGLTVGAVKFSKAVKDKSLQAGLIGGSMARTMVEVLQIPAIHSKLPDPITAVLLGNDSAFGNKKVATVGSDELEKFINIEAQRRAEAMLPAVIQQIEQSQDQTRQEPFTQDDFTETEDETFGGDEDTAWE